MHKDVDNKMEDLLKQILEEQKKTNQRLDQLEGQLNETNQIVKAIQHNQEFTNAKLEGIELTTAKAQALTILDDKFEALNKRLFAQETEIQGLKRVK